MRLFKLAGGFISVGCGLVSFLLGCVVGFMEGITGNVVADVLLYGPLLMIAIGIFSVLMCWNKSYTVSGILILGYIIAAIMMFIGIKEYKQSAIFGLILTGLAIGQILVTIYQIKDNKKPKIDPKEANKNTINFMN